MAFAKRSNCLNLCAITLEIIVHLMHSFLEFISFSDPTVRYVTLSVMLLASCTAVIGVFSLLQKKSLAGDAIAHAVLPGICIAFLFSGTKSYSFLIAGAFITSWLAMFLIDYIPAHSKIKEDAATAMVLSVFFGAGMVVLTYIQHKGNAEQAGLHSFLFGKAASLMKEDMILLCSLAILLFIIVVLFFKEFRVVIFDKHFAHTIGLPVKAIEQVLRILAVVAIVIGIQAVGIVLMAAMLITPPAAARFWTDRLSKMVLLSAAIGMMGGFSGAYVSYTTLSMPTGPWIVMVVAMIALASFMLAPKKGIFAKLWRQRRYQEKVSLENILKSFYEIGDGENDFYAARTIENLQSNRPFKTSRLKHGIRKLLRKKYLVQRQGGTFALTEAGKEAGARVLKLHLLWEAYLTKYLKIKPDHVHEDAESIEHIITPELEKELESLLKTKED